MSLVNVSNQVLGDRLRELLKETVEAMLEAEMDEHLGYTKHAAIGDNSGNSRNGYCTKMLTTSQGMVKISVPRDRNGEYKPRLVPKRRTDIRGIEERLLAMHLLPDRLLPEQVDKVYSRFISPSLLDRVVQKVREVKGRRMAGMVLNSLRENVR